MIKRIYNIIDRLNRLNDYKVNLKYLNHTKHKYYVVLEVEFKGQNFEVGSIVKENDNQLDIYYNFDYDILIGYEEYMIKTNRG